MSRQASGLRAWALQRISAAYLGLYLIYMLGHLSFNAPETYEAWRAYIADPGVTIGMLLFVTALLIHAWVGIRDVLIDYVHPIMARVGLLSLFAIGFIGCGLWFAKAVFLASVAA